MELADQARKKELVGVQKRNHLQREKRNGEWLRAVPHHLTERSCLGNNSGIIVASDMG